MDDIVEVEVLSEKQDEVVKAAKPKKVVNQGRRQAKLLIARSYLERIGNPCAIIFGALTVVFAILYSETHEVGRLVALIIFASMCGLGIMAIILGFILGKVYYHYENNREE